MAFKTVNEYVAALPEPQQYLAKELRLLIKETAPSLTESLKWGVPCYSGKKNICYFVAQTGRLNFGFYEAALLSDPENLLEGTGAKMRHVKLDAGGEFPREALRRLLLQAVAL